MKYFWSIIGKMIYGTVRTAWEEAKKDWKNGRKVFVIIESSIILCLVVAFLVGVVSGAKGIFSEASPKYHSIQTVKLVPQKGELNQINLDGAGTLDLYIDSVFAKSKGVSFSATDSVVLLLNASPVPDSEGKIIYKDAKRENEYLFNIPAFKNHEIVSNDRTFSVTLTGINYVPGSAFEYHFNIKEK